MKMLRECFTGGCRAALIMYAVSHVFCIHHFVPAVTRSTAVKMSAGECTRLFNTADNACFLTYEEVKCF